MLGRHSTIERCSQPFCFEKFDFSFSSYVDYRPETNAVILLDMGHTLRGEHTWEE
jgi:hypothetical protein